MAGDNFRYGVEQRLGVRPDVDVTAAMLLSEGDPCETSRFELDPSDVETPTPALCGSPVIVKPVAHAEPEELRNTVTLGLGSSETLFEVPDGWRLPVDEPEQRQAVRGNGNGDRGIFGKPVGGGAGERHLTILSARPDVSGRPFGQAEVARAELDGLGRTRTARTVEGHH